jgi:TolB-like protein
VTVFRFGDFVLDTARFELRGAGEVVRAEPRVLELLHYLVRNHDRVVPKEELLDKLWPDTHVSDSALTSTVRDARRALSDSPTSPRWIKTVYGRGFRFVGQATSAADAEPAPQADPRKSNAVLPIADLSPSGDQSYFCDGMAEELISSLTRIEELRVVSRAIAFDFRSDDDLRVLGEKLGVDHILRGSVRKADDRLRITVHLVDVRSGHHVWSEKYDRTTGDIFALQEDIAEHTARALLGVLTERNRKAIKSTPVRLDVYEFYLKARTYLRQSALDQAIEMFEIALEFDPDYAPAQTGLAEALRARGVKP